MSEFPKNWIAAKFESINEFKSQSINPANYPEETFELWSVPSYATGKPELLIGKAIGSTKQKVQPKDVLVCKINPRINRVWQVGKYSEIEQIASSEWIVFRSSILISTYLQYFFSSPLFREKICIEVTGVGGSLTRAQPKRVATYTIPLAPLNEQKRIADKLDRVLARVDACREKCDRIPPILKRFRQSVLAAATSGQLTEDWRDLQSKTKATQLVSLKDVALNFNYGTSAKSSRTGSIPVLRMGNIQDGQLDWNDLVFTSDVDEIEKYKLFPGDLLFNRTNSPELVGKTAVYKGERPSIYAGYLIRIRCGENLLPDYLNYCLNSPAGRDYCWQVKSDGVSQSNINAKKLAAFEFELPSIEEQKEIVRRVELLFAYADRLETYYQKARAHCDRLTPAILDKAFRGELVPQDPNDEPAAALLERIQAQRSATTKPKRTSKQHK